MSEIDSKTGLLVISENDRVIVRERPWVIRQVAEAEGGQRLCKLEALDGDEPTHLEVIASLEEWEPLASEEVSFDLDQLVFSRRL
ncbi:MAG: hypothetical protein ACUVRD_02150 [Bacteroidia bacterium]